MNVVPVGMGAIEAVASPDALEIRGLGSCVAVGVADPVAGVAALAHTVIPRPLRRELPGPGWATSEAVPATLDALVAAGGVRRRAVVHLAGGASMFSSFRRSFQVGEENAKVAEATVAALGLPVLTRDLGGVTSRRVLLEAATGRMAVSSRELERASGAPRLRPWADAEREWASILLHRAVQPLSRLLERPVAVEEPGAYELTPDELGDFFGGVGSRVWWASTRLDAEDFDGELGVVLPEEHALEVGRALAEASDDEVETDDVLAEVANLVTAHTTEALAFHLRLRILPAVARTGRAPTREAVRQVRRALPPGSRVLALHGRVHAERLLRGVDLALLLPPALSPVRPAP